MSESVVYRSALGYELIMRALYGRHYDDRMRVLAELVPAGASVLELCCGPGTLYTRYLRERAGSYVGVDVNERFVGALRDRGIDARCLDLAQSDQPLPGAQVVIMQASLYHFIPRAEEIVNRMLAAAGQRVIISEPIRNLTSSGVPIVRLVGRRAADPGLGSHEQRFTERTLDRLMQRYGERVVDSFLIPGGREKVYVLDPRARGAP